MESTPSKARYVVTAFAVSLAVITYIDRVGISVALPLIRDELKLSPIQMGWTLAAFAWAYALFEIPGGALGDRIGPRRVLMRIVIWWSFFTAATGWVWNPTSLVVTRALFGAGEAGAFPNITRVLATWLPVKERERAQAIVWLATRVSGAFTPLLVAMLISGIGWRRTFEVFGVLGVIWAVLFYRWYRDVPSEHPAVNAAELAMLPPAKDTAIAHTGVPWGLIFSNPNVWLLSLQYMCLAYGWWFYINWLPTYLRDARGASFRMGALLAGLPLLLGGAGCLVSAFLVPRLTKRYGSVVRRAAHHRRHRIRRCFHEHRHLHAHRRPGAGDVRARDGRLLQRLRDARGVGQHHGRRRALRRHRLGRDEHDGQCRRCPLGDGRGVSLGVDVRQLDADLLHLVGDLPARGDLLAVPGFAHASRARRDGLANRRLQPLGHLTAS